MEMFYPFLGPLVKSRSQKWLTHLVKAILVAHVDRFLDFCCIHQLEGGLVLLMVISILRTCCKLGWIFTFEREVKRELELSLKISSNYKITKKHSSWRQFFLSFFHKVSCQIISKSLLWSPFLHHNYHHTHN